MPTNYAKLRKTVPMPETCPRCGVELTPSNAELEHVVPPQRGGTDDPENFRWVCKRCNRVLADHYERVLEYYSKINELSSGKKASPALLKSMTYSLSVEEVEEQSKTSCQTLDRLTAYRDLLAEDLRARELAETISDLAEAFDDEEITARKTIMLNGNEFSFLPDFRIEDYKQVLSKIGEQTKGNCWNVDLNEDGEVMLTE